MTSLSDSFNYAAFFEGLATRIATLKELRKAYDKEMAFDFIATHFFQPNENKFSEILAFFLDPSETHGQGDTFLRIFCEMFLNKDQNYNDLIQVGVVVQTEHSTSEKRRIDITIDYGGKFIVGIENKIDAIDQEKQVEHYCDYMNNKWPNYLCLYLSRFGDAPSENSISKEKRNEYGLYLDGESKGSDNRSPRLKCISYKKDIIELLEKCAATCQAPIVTAFIKDFQKYIRNEILGDKDMTIDNKIGEYITRDDQYMETALRVHANIYDVHKKLWEKIKTELKDINSGYIEVSNEYWGECDEDNFRILIKISHKNEPWYWQLYFDIKNDNCVKLMKEVAFDKPEYCSGGILSKLEKELLGYNILTNKNLISPCGEYAASWRTSDQPWLDMLTMMYGKSVFVTKILEWYTDARNIVQEYVKDKNIDSQ